MIAQPPLSATFAALGDATRLAIVQRLLAEGDCTVGEIAARCPISMPAVSRHLKVLERAGLIERRVSRQWRVCRARPEALKEVAGWVEQHRAFWSGALDRLDRLMARHELAERKKRGDRDER